MNQEMFNKLSLFDQENIKLLPKLFKRSDKKPVAALELYPRFMEYQKKNVHSGLSGGKFLELLFKAQLTEIIANDGFAHFTLMKKKKAYSA